MTTAETATPTNTTEAPEFAPYWTSLRSGRLAFPWCNDCGRHHWYPMQRCPHCGSAAIEWSQVSGEGTLYSWTVVRHAFSPDYRDKVPYTVALVEFPDAPGVRLVTQLLHDAVELRCEMPVTPVFESVASDRPLVFFRAG
jgi:uncharacterized OB-fold protein